MRRSRTAMLVIAAGASLALAACASGPTEPGADDGTVVLNVLTFGGSLGEANMKIAEGFEEEFNVRINWTESTPVEAVAKVVAGIPNQVWDVAFSNSASQYTGSLQGAWEKIDPAIVTNAADIYDLWQTTRDDGLVYGTFPTGIYYNIDEFKKQGWDPPTSYQDLLRPEFCNVVSFPHPDNVGGVHGLLGLGTAPQNDTLEKQFLAGLDILAEHKDCFATFEPSSSVLDQAILTDQYYIGLAGMSRILPMQDSGKNIGFVIPKEGAFHVMSTINVAKNAPHKELAQELVNWFNSPEAEVQQMELTYYAPTNSKAEIDPEFTERGIVTGADADSIREYSDQVVSENHDKWWALWDEKIG